MPRLRPGERFDRTFYGRLLIGQLVVGAVLVVTMAVVAGTIGPSLFHLHLVQNGPLESSDDLIHADGAFSVAFWISLSVAVLVAGVVAFAIGLATVRPLRRQLRQLAEMASAVAAGDYDRRLDPGAAGDEILVLADSLNSMAARLNEAEDARKRLLADLAHELRTPIASLSVTVEAVADGVLEPDAATLSTLAEQADRLTRLAGDLRDISDAEGGLAVHPLSCDVAGLLEKARAAAAEAYAAKGVRLEVDGAPAGTVRADAQRVGQVLANLLSNALRHTPSGGRVSLGATVGTDGGVLTVTDTGDGIEEEHLPYVFERFYRTDTARARDAGGTGIGLAISSEIARAHGGSLTAASPGRDQGATFTLTLPPSGA
jgi:two-component system sensor histidine kinase BaeS